MSNDVFVNVNKQVQNALAPVVQVNRVAVANLEKLVEFQLQTLPSYVELGLGQLKAAAEVTEPQALQAFYASQVEVARTLRQKLVADSKALAKLGNDFVAEVSALARESVAKAAPEAA
ncbi:MAG: phasin family protein [Pseudomonadota bacterium]|nr:phasin family protein [Pseudomonadota bacterium]